MPDITEHCSKDLLAALEGIEAKSRVLGGTLVTMAVGGTVPYLFEPNTIEQLSKLLVTLPQFGLRYRVLGAGSNVVIDDAGLSEAIIRLGPGFKTLKFISPTSIEVGASYSLMSLSREMSKKGLSGLEFAGGIPASVGGAVRMNAGAHGSEMSKVVRAVNVMRGDGDVESLPAEALQFSYRHSAIPAGAVLLSAVLDLTAEEPKETLSRRAQYLAERRLRQPLQFPSSGSVFCNPSPQQPAGRLIEQVGLRGCRYGGAQISALHGNWIVNPDRQARSADVLCLIELCKAQVRERFGLDLKEEVIHWV